jgi:hypothetical protein
MASPPSTGNSPTTIPGLFDQQKRHASTLPKSISRNMVCLLTVIPPSAIRQPLNHQPSASFTPVAFSSLPTPLNTHNVHDLLTRLSQTDPFLDTSVATADPLSVLTTSKRVNSGVHPSLAVVCLSSQPEQAPAINT